MHIPIRLSEAQWISYCKFSEVFSKFSFIRQEQAKAGAVIVILQPLGGDGSLLKMNKTPWKQNQETQTEMSVCL